MGFCVYAREGSSRDLQCWPHTKCCQLEGKFPSSAFWLEEREAYTSWASLAVTVLPIWLLRQLFPALLKASHLNLGGDVQLDFIKCFEFFSVIPRASAGSRFPCSLDVRWSPPAAALAAWAVAQEGAFGFAYLNAEMVEIRTISSVIYDLITPS